MKYGVFFLFFLLYTCSEVSKKEDFENQIEQYYKATMYNPDSYKLVGSTIKEGVVFHEANKEFLKSLRDKNHIKSVNDSLIKIRLENQYQVFFKIAAKNAVGVRVQNIISGYFINGELEYVDGKKVN